MKTFLRLALIATLGWLFCVMAMVVGHDVADLINYHWIWLTTAAYTGFHCFFTGCGEETAFRLLLMDRLMEQRWKWSAWLSVPISSAIFGAMHLVNGKSGQALGAAICGVLFAYIYKRYGLFAAIMLHATYNWLIYMRYLSPIFEFFR